MDHAPRRGLGRGGQGHPEVAEDHDALVAKLVANWPDVPEKRKAELGRLLTGP
ncbi:hypothetical protein STRTUCAR8_01759 [Streptomyces turgidiscabies Car8]|uniref:Uncharacterized protein n=1 Tax=Streptomyces turgidiscabies (strain Car8) TaxID=698760 RepID=L7F4F5_STRT8|nr:hypothetical protein STRTUCAR8_01759 [Streptomyces turgidiscabies Car8]